VRDQDDLDAARKAQPVEEPEQLHPTVDGAGVALAVADVLDRADVGLGADVGEDVLLQGVERVDDDRRVTRREVGDGFLDGLPVARRATVDLEGTRPAFDVQEQGFELPAANVDFPTPGRP
jgi:hypothetical protein